MQYLVTKQISYALGKTGKTIPFAEGVSGLITNPMNLGKEAVKSGFVLRSGGKRQRYQCKECGYCLSRKKGEDAA